ncbi:MAG: hypothetical protein Q8P52_00500 [bacterium]|nr:hypothetical protein [bacterium]
MTELQNDTGNRRKSEGPSPLRTYKGDIAELIKNENTSLSDIAIAEQKRAAESTVQKPDRVYHSKMWVFLAVILIMVSGAAAGTFFIVSKDRKVPETGVQNVFPRQLLSADSNKTLDLSNMSRRQMLESLKKVRDETSITLNKVLAIYPPVSDGRISFKASYFISNFAPHSPEDVARSVADNFVIGFHSFKKNEPFLILKTTSYLNTFAGMLAWERYLEDDMGDFFIFPERRDDRVATTSKALVESSSGWSDKIIKNRDTRVLKNGLGEIVMLYAFTDNQTLVITTTPETLEEVTKRLFAIKLVQ